MALIVPAYAKLNLTLDVVGRRPNGYHDIDSVMQTVSLHDLLSIEPTDCRVLEVVGPPIDGENLILKAARELEGHLSRALPFTVRLFKRIPMGAGLGGGSADAAAFLKAANQVYDLRLKPDELNEIAAGVGQDVPFFLRGGTARATGLGSEVSPLPPVASSWRILLLSPPVQVSTRTVYEAVDGRVPSAHRTPALVEALGTPSPNASNARIARSARLAWAGGPALPTRGREIVNLQGGREIFGNDLESVARKLFPALGEAVERLRAVVPSLTMTGTGAALFAVFPTRHEAEAALAAVRPMEYPAWVCRPIAADA